MLAAAKTRAKAKNLDFNIEESDILIPDICPILKIPLVINKGKPQFNSPTLDRIDNTLGYIKGNIAVISRKANDYKSNMTLEDISNLYNYSKTAGTNG